MKTLEKGVKYAPECEACFSFFFTRLGGHICFRKKSNGYKILILHYRRLHGKTVIGFQYFASSIENMKNIHSSLTNQID